MLGKRVEQRSGLQPVARCVRARLFGHTALVDRPLHARHNELLAELGGPTVAQLDHLREVMPRVHVQEREREASRPKRLLRQPQQDE